MRLIVSFILVLFFTGSFAQIEPIVDSVDASSIKISSSEHTESFDGFGVVLRSLSGSLLSCYRESFTHARDAGKVVMRKSTDNGLTWSKTKFLFGDSVSDYRDIKGGVLASGTIVLFWRKVDFITLESPVYFSRSVDTGETWSEPLMIPDSAVAYGGTMTLPDSSEAMVVGKINGPSAEGYIELYLYKSMDDGQTWIRDKRISASPPYEYLQTEEVSIISLGDSRLFGIGRGFETTNLLRFYSDNLGESWNITETNLGPSVKNAPFWSLISPWLFQASSSQLDLWYGERLYEMRDGRIQEVGGRLYSIIFDINEAVTNPLNFGDTTTLAKDRFVEMGYPSIVSLSDGEFFGQFYSSTSKGLPDIFSIHGNYIYK